MDFLSCSYDTLFLNLWPLIAGVLLSWHCGLINVQGSSDCVTCSLFFFPCWSPPPFFRSPVNSLELGVRLLPLPLRCHIYLKALIGFYSVVYFTPLYYIPVLVLRT